MKYNNAIKSIAIGSFDGIHIAHQTLINKADAIVIIERNGGYLTPGYKRSNFTSKVCCFYHFDVIKGLTPKIFIEKLQTDFPKLEKIIVGYDFIFGKDRVGNTKMLQELFNGRVEIVKEVLVEGISVHSRTIKKYLREGNIAKANSLLGRRYSIEGEVISGQGLGKKELVPTLNLNVKEYQLPKEGVYTTVTTTESRIYKSVSFLGHRVTTDGSFAVETHVIDEDIGDVQGVVELAFVDFIRPNQKFKSLKVLKEQIEDDITKAKSKFV